MTNTSFGHRLLAGALIGSGHGRRLNGFSTVLAGQRRSQIDLFC
jgi:hypothetical protein